MASSTKHQCVEINLAEEKEGNNGKGKISSNPKSKRFSGSFTYKVRFKGEWEDLYPMKKVLTDKYKFYFLLCGKFLTSHHGGLNDLKKNFNWPAHHVVVDQWKKQKKLPCALTN